MSYLYAVSMNNPELHSFPTRRSSDLNRADTGEGAAGCASGNHTCSGTRPAFAPKPNSASRNATVARSEEHTSELQSHSDLVCRLLLAEKHSRDRAWAMA